MAGRNFHLSTGSLFFTWLIAGIVILLLPPSVTGQAHFLFQKTFRPVLQLGRQIQLSAISKHSDNGEITQEEYDKLWKSYKNLHAQLLQLHEDYETLAEIRSALPTPFSELVLARVTGSVNSFSHKVIINKGTDAGVKPGQYVLSAGQNSIIGIVDETAKQLAKVLLLTDSKQKIPVQIRREGEMQDVGGLMVGDGKTGCRIANIKEKQGVKVGDAVFARVHPGLLNAPVVIGKVVEVRPDDKHPLLLDITVQPIEDMGRLNDVAVIVVEDF